MLFVVQGLPWQLVPSTTGALTHWYVVMSQVSTVHGLLSSQDAGQAGPSMDPASSPGPASATGDFALVPQLGPPKRQMPAVATIRRG
jgi:hypothetical protein